MSLSEFFRWGIPFISISHLVKVMVKELSGIHAE
jgi:hypothetical protein